MSVSSYISVPTAESCQVECICPELVLPVIGKVVSSDRAEAVSRLFYLLSDSTRVRILHSLTLAEELCVCDIAFLIDVSQSAVSHQLRILRSAGVVKRRKSGRTVFYSVADTAIAHALSNGIQRVDKDAEHAQA